MRRAASHQRKSIHWLITTGFFRSAGRPRGSSVRVTSWHACPCPSALSRSFAPLCVGGASTEGAAWCSEWLSSAQSRGGGGVSSSSSPRRRPCVRVSRAWVCASKWPVLAPHHKEPLTFHTTPIYWSASRRLHGQRSALEPVCKGFPVYLCFLFCCLLLSSY